MATILKIRDIGLSKYETNKYISIFLYIISKKKDNSKVYT